MKMQKILATFDFSEAAGRAVSWAHNLASATGARLELVHVHPDLYDGHSTPALGLPWPSEGQEERYLRFLQQELRNVLVNMLGPSGAEVPIHIERGDPVKRVLAVADTVAADMICVGATGKGAVQRVLLGSVSQHILRASKVPVLIVH